MALPRSIFLLLRVMLKSTLICSGTVGNKAVRPAMDERFWPDQRVASGEASIPKDRIAIMGAAGTGRGSSQCR